MRIGHMCMCMRMAPRFVPVPVAVRAGGHGLVQVIVVTVVVAVGVLVLQRLVFVLMAVRLGQVQQHAGQQPRDTARQGPAGRAVAQGGGEQRPDEGCKSKHRAGAGSAEGALREQL